MSLKTAGEAEGGGEAMTTGASGVTETKRAFAFGGVTRPISVGGETRATAKASEVGWRLLVETRLRSRRIV